MNLQGFKIQSKWASSTSDCYQMNQSNLERSYRVYHSALLKWNNRRINFLVTSHHLHHLLYQNRNWKVSEYGLHVSLERQRKARDFLFICIILFFPTKYVDLDKNPKFKYLTVFICAQMYVLLSNSHYLPTHLCCKQMLRDTITSIINIFLFPLVHKDQPKVNIATILQLFAEHELFLLTSMCHCN